MAEKVIKIKVDKTTAQKQLKDINKDLKNGASAASVFNGSIKNATGGVAAMIPMVARLGGVIGAGVGVMGAATVATLKYAKANADAIVSIDNLAKKAGINAQAFQAYSQVAKEVNIDQQQFADILKDTNEKVGEFLSEGGGEFKEVFEGVLKPMGITIEQLREMSSVDVLGAVQTGMEDVGANGKEMTAIFEKIASDASVLSPLLEDNALRMREVAKASADMGLVISDEQITNAREFNKEYAKLEAQTKGVANSLKQELEPVFNSLVGLANDLMFSIRKMLNIGIDAEIANIDDELARIDRRIANIGKSSNTYGATTGSADVQRAILENEKILKQRERAAKLAEQEGLASNIGGSAGGVLANATGSTGNSSTPVLAPMLNPSSGKAAADLQKAMLDSWIEQVSQYNMTATELNDTWRQSELDKLEQWRTDNLDKEDQYNEAFFDINKKWADKQSKLDSKAEQEEQDKRDKRLKDEQAALSAGFEAFSSIADATEGRSDKLNALVQGAAVFQATSNAYLAASQALALPSDVSLPQKMASYAAVLSAGMGVVGSLNGLSPSRQTGGYMMGGTPYQVGGGAHTTDPEMYQSGGKSYLVDSQSGTMTRLSGGSNQSASQSAQAVNWTFNNYGQEATATVTDGGIDENGVRQMIIEMTPNILAKEVNNPSSPYSQAVSVNYKSPRDYS